MNKKKKLKAMAGSALAMSGLYGRSFGDRAMIVAFHRIDDRYPNDPISCTVNAFRDFCLFFKRHFEIVTLKALLDDLEQGRSISRKLAVTFDDGYLDNYTSAAPVLSELSIPATFFIATGFIGTDRVPWWDEDAGIRSEWMDWHHLEELVSAGFTLGAHTVNHVDLGVVSGDEARKEIDDSRRVLEDRLGIAVDLFAFPYGRAHQLSEENRATVRELGLRCAPSCEGGLVLPGDDPYRLRRVPISPWYESVGQFAWEVRRR